MSQSINALNFKFGELSSNAKSKAIEAYKLHCNFDSYYDDNHKSLTAFVQLFPIKIIDIVEYRGNYDVIYSFTCDDLILNLYGQRLAVYLSDNYRDKICGKECPLTGYCMDIVILQEIWSFIEAPNGRSFEDLLGGCLSQWATAASDDLSLQYTEEYVVNFIESNDFRFTGSGDYFYG